ncbi:polymorphic toxin-type HINT domain-containing protein [Dactylosporangium sp. NPDC006015]|uniref:polymorphic toxin-type HINT domain-containing protein n=1 Tax=Dactylosporangium sp. NPDC006015 TaxID=3154576 RepID=UPI0033A40B0F
MATRGTGMSKIRFKTLRPPRPGRAPARRTLLRALALTLVTSGFVALPSVAEAKPVKAPAEQQWSSVQGGKAATPAAVRKPAAAPVWTPPAVSWPAAGSATVDLTAADAQAADAARTSRQPAAVPSTKAGELPVRVARGSAGPTKLKISLADRTASERAGVKGFLLQAQPAEPAAQEGQVRVSVDPAQVAGQYGGDFANRLRLVTLPPCSLSTPEVAACTAQTAVHTTRDRDGTLSGLVTIPAGGQALRDGKAASSVVFALTAGASGTSGDYGATPLKPAGSWSAGNSSGDFGYTYPIPLPPVPGTLSPSVSLAYSSQSMDGKQVATNNQSSPIGDGWSYDPGSVERTYRTCSDDDGSPKKTGDSCWAGPIVHVAFGAGSGDLIYDTSVPTHWKLSTDDGARVELLTGADNGDNDGEYWKITTKDGTQYFFGLNKLPGWASGKDATNSAWTQRVYAPRSADPCYKSSGFDASYCDQAYKWNLDYVVDTHHNAYAYYYKTEQNYYGPNGSTTGVPYVRGGYVDHIDYGLRDPDPYATSAPARVKFDNTERCIESDTVCAPANIVNAKTKWPDTPYDLNCDAGKACNNHSVSFWTRIRTKGIATQIWNGSAYTSVDSFALQHSFPSPEDGTTPGLWLESIKRTGGTGTGAITLPATTFEFTRLANRADGIDGAPAMNHHRISTITTETGEVIGIGYKTECTAPVTIVPSQNTSLCYPVYWTPEGASNPTLDWFHKYVVTEVSDQDPTGKSPVQTSTYEYLDGGAWHLDDNELTKAKHRTYGQWRGYGRVRTRTGSGLEARTLSETRYYRGMDGDKLPDGTRRTATVALSTDVTVAGAAQSVPDTAELSGQARQTIQYTSDGGPVESASVTDYWVSLVLAHRARTGLDDLASHMTRAVTTRNTNAITSSTPTKWLTTRTDTTYDTTTGLPTVQYDYGDVTDPSLATCTTTTYAPANTAANIVGLVAAVETDAVPCGGSGVNGLTAPTSVSRPAQVISRSRTFYDTDTFDTTWPQAAPTVGNVSVTQVAFDYRNGAFDYLTKTRVTYDQYGRTVRATDANDTTGTTAYTLSNGLTTKVVATNAVGQSTTTVFDPSRGLATASTDLNNLTTTVAYDALGRATGVWRPGRALNQGANLKFTYQISQTVPSAISTSSLNDDGTYRTTIALYDALTRPRQTQSPTPVGGRIVSDTFYDGHGWVVKTNNAYYDATSLPSTTMLDMTGKDNQIPDQQQVFYDGTGRKIREVAFSKGVQKHEAKTVYGGDRTTVLPPEGGTPTTQILDSAGRPIELDSYTTMPTVNGSVVTGGNPVKITYGYDARHNMNRTTDDKGNSWTSTYDLLGQVIGTTDPDAGGTTSTYDNNGNLLTSTNHLQEKTSYKYDDLGRKVAQYDGDTTTPPVATWTYDSTTISNGIGELASSSSFVNGYEYKTEATGFNSWGGVLGTTVTIPAAPGNGALANTYTFTNTYSTTNGLLQKTAYPNAGGLPAETVNRTYTAMDLPSGVGSSLGDYVDNTKYNPFSGVSQTKFGFGTTNVAWRTHVYDEFTHNIVNSYVDRTGTGTTRMDDVVYRYNAGGQIVSATNARNNNATSETQCFRYDLLGRLTTAWTATDLCAADVSVTGSNTTVGGINPYWTSWTYNTLGDQTGEVRHAVPGVTGGDTKVDYAYPTNGSQPHTLQSATTTSATVTKASTFTYDTMGRTITRVTPERDTQTFTWDRHDKLLAVKTGSVFNAGYVYDPDGGLLIQRNPSANTTTLFLPGQELTLHTDTNVVTGRRYYSAPDGAQCVRTGTTATAYSYLFSDSVGTATLSLDRNGANPTWRAVTPFGAPRGAQPANWPDTHGYLGKSTDATTGLTILGARHYDPVIGRFISVDPLLSTEDPNQLGGYSYAGNDPINSSDPSGLQGSASCAPGYVGGPGGCTGTENDSGSSGDYCWSATTRCDMPGWSPPPPKASPPSKKKKKKNCGFLCSAWDASADWAMNHAELVGAVAGIAAGIAVGAICTGATFGAGAVGCAAIAGAVGGAVSGAVTHGLDVAAGRADGSSVMGWVGAVGVGAVVGAVAGAVGAVAGAAALGGAVAWASGQGLKAAGQAAIAAGRTAITGAARGAAAAEGAAAGSEEGAAANTARRAATSCRACPCNSFSPDTPVLMADGTVKAIKDVDLGDWVLATDPVTGKTEPRLVTALHDNLDHDLVDVFVRDAAGTEQVVRTTANHAFWSVSAGAWIPAGKLLPDELVRTADGGTVPVLGVDTRPGSEHMLNLTVADAHTYYVTAGTSTVLVHNSGIPGWARDAIRAITGGNGSPNNHKGTQNQKLWTGTVADEHGNLPSDAYKRKWGAAPIRKPGFQGSPEWNVPGRGPSFKILGPNADGDYGYTSNHYKKITDVPKGIC